MAADPPMSISYYVEVTVTIDGYVDRAGVEKHVVDVAEAFSELADIDGDVGVDYSNGRIELCMTVNAADEQDALGKAVTAARTAVHAAGGKTAGWERILSKIREYKSCHYDERLFQQFGMAVSGAKVSFVDGLQDWVVGQLESD